MDITYVATITCPHCGAEHTETMPEDACAFFYTCSACETTLRPAAGDCCVFCTWADVPCPPIQRQRRATDAPRDEDGG